MAETLGILFLVVVAPIWLVLHYGTAWRKTKSLTKGDEQLLEELWNLSQRLEERIDTLEVILDRDNKDWSKK
ncbi:MAG: envelope stress response membrane protein PspB [Gammaproteobacteria bacterium]|nr:envelope stress response membrane protein PspB [Gammaproteobacteria bacterium]NNM14141.1 envelope stress response membrane protein PspB [Gammaproteobacteria bacterium]